VGELQHLTPVLVLGRDAADLAQPDACAALNIPLVHISIDYMFPGTGHHPWAPGDATRPDNAYGHSKWAGEQAIPTSAYPTPAARRLNSRLECNTNTSVFGLVRSDWHAGLKEFFIQFGVPT
jgi:dTDP-4-dehydrorhamnose reductase